MPRYRYTAIDVSGRRVTGERDASDPDALLAAIVHEVREVESVQLVEAGRQAAALDSDPPERIHPGDASEISGHIAEIIESQLPLESGLAAIAAECPSRRMRRALRSIAGDLASGNDLETVLAGRRAPPELKALVRAGARSGNTSQILEHYVLNMQGAAELRQTIRWSMLYPVVLLVVFGSWAAFVAGWVVPQFEEIFKGFGAEVPEPTQWLIDGSRFCVTYGLPIVLTGLAAVVAMVLLWRMGMRWVELRRLVCSVPFVGPILRWTALARFSQLLSLLIENQVPLDEALALAGNASGDAEIENDCRQMLKGVTAGETLATAARKLDRFPTSFFLALTWERRSSGLPEVMQSLGDMYAGRVRTAVALLATVIPPFLMVVLCLLASSLMTALYMPLIALLKNLSS